MKFVTKFLTIAVLLSTVTVSADQIWDHQFTLIADLVTVSSSGYGCPAFIRISTNQDNEIHFEAPNGFVNINGFGIIDGRFRSINGFKTSFERTKEGFHVESIYGNLVYGNTDTQKGKLTLKKGATPGEFTATTEHWRKEHLVTPFYLEESATCVLKEKSK